MTEIGSGSSIPVAGLESKTPKTYPYSFDVQFESGVRSNLMGLWHFDPDPDWQLGVLEGALSATVGPVSPTEKWIGLLEGPIPQVDLDAPIEAAFNAGGESGVLAWHMGRMGHAVESWDSDLLVAAELKILIDGFDALPDQFKRLWRSKEELGEWYAYLVWTRAEASYIGRLRSYDERTVIEDPEQYIPNRLEEKFAAISLFSKYGIDMTTEGAKERRREIYDEMCKHAQDEPVPPFDMLEAYKKRYTRDAYFNLLSVPLDVPYEDYNCGKYSRMQRLGSFSGHIRNGRLADVTIKYVRDGVNVFALGGGGHVARTAPILCERADAGEIASTEWHIGALACMAAFQ